MKLIFEANADKLIELLRLLDITAVKLDVSEGTVSCDENVVNALTSLLRPRNHAPVKQEHRRIPDNKQNPPRQYKEKVCSKCGQKFIPRAGRQTVCDSCAIADANTVPAKPAKPEDDRTTVR